MSAARVGSTVQPSQLAAAAEPVYARLQGGGAAAPIGADAFFGLRFGVRETPGQDAAIVNVPLQPLGEAASQEVWAGPAVVTSSMADGIGVVWTASHLMAHVTMPLPPDADISAATSEVYGSLLARIRDLGYPHLVRIWNFIPDINRGCGDDEAYVRFNHGRAVVLDGLEMPPAQYPAATAVGTPRGSPFVVIALASRTEPVAIENPRQTRAYLYPRQYGPRPPAFTRATLLPDRQGARLFISGTASIVGHDTQHRGTLPQLREIFTNLERLIGTALAQPPGYVARGHGTWRVYLRNAEDLAAATDEVQRRLGREDSVVFLQADLCRRELLVEIEGVCELAAPGK